MKKKINRLSEESSPTNAANVHVMYFGRGSQHNTSILTETSLAVTVEVVQNSLFMFI